jgi:probable HAF family extracellular repeat protein
MPDSSCTLNTYEFKPVIWTNGEIQQLPTSGIDSNGREFKDADGVVFRINDRGQAVGATGKCTGFTGFSNLNGQHATLWQNGSVIDLGNLGGIAAPPPATGLGSIGNFAYYVNRSGHVVGTSGTSDGSFHAFLWTPETLIQDVGTIPANGTAQADVASIGLSINDHGDIGGISFPEGSLLAIPTALPRAFLRPNGGTMVDLNSLIPADSALYLFTTCSINSGGDFVGLALDAQSNFHGYLATRSDGAEDSSPEFSTELRAARFEQAWSLASQRMGSAFHNKR